MDTTMGSSSKIALSMKNNNYPAKIYRAVFLNMYNITQQTELKSDR